ncbi:MAG: GDP-mannose 4,6-dehydratase [Actinomycetota bacterium]|nr:GDP-mannose 4,6-dehydratase [Actinomycetota bacterium]
MLIGEIYNRPAEIAIQQSQECGPAGAPGSSATCANNVTATRHLLEAVRAVPERRVVYASSSSVYGQAETLPTAESD